jgi:hypothetical protein
MVSVAPLAGYLTVSLLPISARSSILATPDESPTARWATIEALGAGIRDLHPTDTVLVSVHQAVMIGDLYLLPAQAVLLRRESEKEGSPIG